jgi:Protein kinase domain
VADDCRYWLIALWSSHLVPAWVLTRSWLLSEPAGGGNAPGAAAPRGAAASQGSRLCGADRAGPGGRPREGDRSPGSEAREHLSHEGRIAEDPDFGLAKLTQTVALAITDAEALTAAPGTEVGVVLGTAPYMSPEQMRGQRVDPRSDLFSFGAVLYEMLSGERAFPGTTTADTMAAILTKDPPPLSERIPPRRRAFCPDGDLGSSNRPFSMKAPRADVSERGGPGLPDPGGRAAPGEPARANRLGMNELEWVNVRAPSGRAKAKRWSPRGRRSVNPHCGPTVDGYSLTLRIPPAVSNLRL